MTDSFQQLEKLYTHKTDLPGKKLSALFDAAGIPKEGCWRAVYRVIFDVKIHEMLDKENTIARKRLEPVVIQALENAKNEDFSQKALLDLIRQYHSTYFSLCHNQLADALNELDTFADEFKTMSLERQKNVEELQSDTVSAVESDLSLQDKIKLIKARFKETISMFQQDMMALDRMNNTDHLTGVYNRRFFDEQLDIEVFRALREKTWLHLLMIDIDNFKAFNDTYGHLVGDQALKTIAKNIQAICFDETARTEIPFFPTRYGGEEFAVILPAIGQKEVLDMAEFIRAKISDYTFVIRNNKGTIKHKDLNLTVSIGVASLNHSHEQEQGILSLIKNADAAMYKAKKEGKNRVESKPG